MDRNWKILDILPIFFLPFQNQILADRTSACVYGDLKFYLHRIRDHSIEYRFHDINTGRASKILEVDRESRTTFDICKAVTIYSILYTYSCLLIIAGNIGWDVSGNKTNTIWLVRICWLDSTSSLTLLPTRIWNSIGSIIYWFDYRKLQHLSQVQFGCTHKKQHSLFIVASLTFSIIRIV